MQEDTSGKAVGVWIRVSTADQAAGQSPETHRSRAEFYAKSREWNIVETYDLSGVSGKAILEHPETKRMMEDVKTGRITGLIFSTLARLARNTKELLQISEFFKQHKADLVSIKENIDTSTPSGILTFTVLSALGQFEREELAERVSAAAVTRAKMGKRVAGAAPFGYRWRNGEIELHPKEAPVRKLMFELFAEHKRKGTVASLLTERGYKTRRGKNFSKTGIQSLLRDPIAKGKRRCNYTYAEHRGGKVHLKPEEEWEWHDCPAVVGEDLWNRCNQILDEQMQTRAPGRRGRYLFAGKVKCEHDLHTMYVLSEAPRFVCRKCRNKLGQEELEQLFRKQLLDFFTSEEDLTKFLGEQQGVLEEKKRQTEVLSAEQVEMERNRDKVAMGYLDGKIDKARYDRLERDAEKRIHELKMGIAGLEGEISALTIVHTSSEVVIANARELYGRWDVLTHEEKDSIINSIIDNIVVGERNITFNIRYVPFSAKDGNYIQNTLSL